MGQVILIEKSKINFTILVEMPGAMLGWTEA
jgi:hypothetical protein